MLFINGLPLNNCEFFSFLNAPILYEMSLTRTELTNLKSMAKASIKLDKIILEKNPTK